MHTMYIPNKTNIKLSKRNLSGKNKLICIIYMGAKTDEVIFTKDKCFDKGYKEPHSCLPFCSISILQHLIALSEYLPLSLKQPFCFAFAFQTGLFFTVSTQALTKTLPRMFTHFFSTSDFKVFFKVSFPILLVILLQQRSIKLFLLNSDMRRFCMFSPPYFFIKLVFNIFREDISTCLINT